MAADETLPRICVFGPALTRKVGKGLQEAPRWELTAPAPAFGNRNIDGDANKSSLEDMHPVRELSTDPNALRRTYLLTSSGTAKSEEVLINVPRLLAAALRLDDAGDGDRKLELFYRKKGNSKPVSVDAKELVSLGSAPQFVSVIVSPQIDKDAPWVDLSGTHFGPVLPRCRLVLGDVVLAFPKSKSVPSLVTALASIGWIPDTSIRIAPDGIILRAKVKFPGADPAKPLEGVFLLAADPGAREEETGWTLTLLPHLLGNHASAWSAAWAAVVPAGSAQQAKSVEVRARLSGLPPAFKWRVDSDDEKKWRLSDAVSVPIDDMQMVLVGRSGEHDNPDGTAQLLAEEVFLSGTPKLVTFRSERAPAATAQWLASIEVSTPSAGKRNETFRLTTKDGGPVAMRHDDRLLAARLRAAHGIEQPWTSAPGSGPPLVYGFAPMDRGWVQVPFVNAPPRNPNLDQDLVGAPAPGLQPSIDGFVRWSSPRSDEIVSAYAPCAPPVLPPWLLTIDGAAGFSASITLSPGASGATILTAGVTLHDAAISTRGLLWVSLDRPGAVEGLPRLGAGPGSLVDVPLSVERSDRDDVRVVRLALDKLEGDAASGRLVARKISVSWNPTAAKALNGNKSVPDMPIEPADAAAWAWLRHETLPLAATMAMTRSGGNSVRPLESRDLAPFTLEPEMKGMEPAVLVRLDFDETRPFCVARPGKVDGKVTLVADWLGKEKELSIAFAALGVPGSEVLPLGDKGWSTIQTAYRYDLPGLDEAFATARLPRTDDATSNPQVSERLEAAPDPPATAVNKGLPHFWGEQRRRHELTRVEDSYFFTFTPTSNTLPAIKVESLVAPGVWQVTCGFDPDAQAKDLPYGALKIADPPRTFSGDEGLRALDLRFERKGTSLAPKGDGPIEVVGWSPSTYDDGGLQFDNRGFGDAMPESAQGEVRRRRIAILPDKSTTMDQVELVTAVNPLVVLTGNRKAFSLWFKDLPLDKSGRFAASAKSDVEADVWSARKAPLAGYEFRCYRDEPFGDVFPFFGFGLEVLRILDFKVTGKGVESVTLLASLTLERPGERPGPGGNFVRLVLRRSDSVLSVAEIVAVTINDDGSIVDKKANLPDLEFALEPEEARSQDSARSLPAKRLVILRTDLTFDATSGEATLASPAIEFTYYGAPWKISVDSVKLNVEATTIRLTRTESLKSPDVPAGLGALVAMNAKLEIESFRATFAFSSELRVPRLTTQGKPDGILVRLTDADVLELFGFDIATTASSGERASEVAGALVRVIDTSNCMGSVCDAFPSMVNQQARGCLVVGFGVKTPAEPMLPIKAGCIEVDVFVEKELTTPVAIQLVRITLTANDRQDAASPRRTAWHGGLKLTGRLRQVSAIAWPLNVRYDTTAHPTIPVPKNGQESKVGSRINVTVGIAGQGPDLASHEATFVFNDHELSPDLFSVAKGGARLRTLTSRWDTLVAAHHVIRWSVAEARRQVEWSSVEPFALVTSEELAQIQADNAKVVETTFMALGGDEGDHKNNLPAPLPLSRFGGLGWRAKALAGSDGFHFRTAFAHVKTEVDTLIAVAGFVGVLRRDEGPHRLLRLPFIASLQEPGSTPSGPLAPQALKQAPAKGARVFRMTWADTTLLPRVLVSHRHAVAVADVTTASLFDAVLTGSGLPPAERTTLGAAVDDAEVAVSVEQAFPLDFGTVSLAETPFWLGAAMGLAETLGRISDPKTIVRGLSLLSARMPTKGKDTVRSLAALLAFDVIGVPLRRIPLRPLAIISVGDDLVVDPIDTAPTGVLRTLGLQALATHPRPRAAVVRRVVTASVPLHDYGTVPLPPPAAAEIPVAPPLELRLPAFPAAQRGYSAAPFDEKSSRAWIGAPLHTAIGAVVDGDSSKEPASGVAGLRYALALPRYVGRSSVEPKEQFEPREIVEPKVPDTRFDDLVWVGEKRVPPYLALSLTNLRSPAIGWLSVAPPRARLPVPLDIERALDSAGRPAHAARRPFLPPAASAMTLAERAGVLTTRRFQLVAPTPDAADFDPVYARFGRAAQTGSSVVRQIRTPRPGPLAPNRGHRGLDRRPWESALVPASVGRLLVGPADALAGQDSAWEWVVLAVAMPQSDGVVSDLWDGTVRIRFEISRKAVAGPGPDHEIEPLRFLSERLFPTVDGKLRARASLRIGDRVVPLKSAMFEADGEWKQENRISRARVDLILDPQNRQSKDIAPTAPGAVHPAVSAVGVQPPPRVSLHLTVHPQSPVSQKEITPKSFYPLTVDEGNELPFGMERPPVTLELPLAPVSSTLGSLPMVPTSLVFRDPAYDRELTNMPAEVRKFPAVSNALPPADRGRVALVLSLDRVAYEPTGTLALMVDVRMETKSRQTYEVPVGFEIDGDLVFKMGLRRQAFDLRFALLSKRDGKVRRLRLAPDFDRGTVFLAVVHEFSLARLHELDNRPSALDSGDLLFVSIAPPDDGKSFDVRIKGSTPKNTDTTLTFGSNDAEATIAVPISSDAVIDPPTALYAALELDPTGRRLSVPLHAQSPYPGRIDAETLKDDLRTGLIRRTATFVWRTARLTEDVDAAKPLKLYLLKQDRNGQTHLPDDSSEFAIPERLPSIPPAEHFMMRYQEDEKLRGGKTKRRKVGMTERPRGGRKAKSQQARKAEGPKRKRPKRQPADRRKRRKSGR